jgi:hypothetical protein
MRQKSAIDFLPLISSNLVRLEARLIAAMKQIQIRALGWRISSRLLLQKIRQLFSPRERSYLTIFDDVKLVTLGEIGDVD